MCACECVCVSHARKAGIFRARRWDSLECAFVWGSVRVGDWLIFPRVVFGICLFFFWRERGREDDVVGDWWSECWAVDEGLKLVLR